MTGVPPPADNPAAVHRGLLALARRRKADFNAILVQYAIERLIDRLSRSPHADRFVLKGAMLFRVWTGELQRPTKDVDFLGHGDPSPAAVTHRRDQGRQGIRPPSFGGCIRRRIAARSMEALNGVG